MPNFIALEVYFIFEAKFPAMRGLILVLMSNVLLGRNFDFLSGYLVVTACYLVATGGYCLLPGG